MKMSGNYRLKQTMLNSTDMFVMIKMLGFLFGLHGGYTNTRVFFGCGTAELMESTTRRSIGLQGKN